MLFELYAKERHPKNSKATRTNGKESNDVETLRLASQQLKCQEYNFIKNSLQVAWTILILFLCYSQVAS